VTSLDTRALLTRAVGALLIAAAGIACAPPDIRQTQPDSRIRAEMWNEPGRPRELFYGTGGRELAPPAQATFVVDKRDPSGFSTTLDLTDPSGREWSAKLGPEAQSEVVSSRIVWALGYHQPPSYFVASFRVKEGAGEGQEGPARFRPKTKWIDSRETWSWHRNPFVGTQAYRGLLVLMMVLNSTDLKDDNNQTYLVARNGRRPVLWYTVKDLGASLGTTGKLYPERNDVVEFEKHGFIERSSGGSVTFAFAGRHQELLKSLTAADVRWTCRRLARLTDRQWHDAFRAGGYPEETRRRYVAKIKAKIAEGLALESRRSAR
jgi:hypothetical protein